MDIMRETMNDKQKKKREQEIKKVIQEKCKTQEMNAIMTIGRVQVLQKSMSLFNFDNSLLDHSKIVVGEKHVKDFILEHWKIINYIEKFKVKYKNIYSPKEN